MKLTFDTIQHFLCNLIYIYLVVQSFLLVRDIKKYQLLHDGIIRRLQPLCYAFSLLLLIKLVVTVVHLAGVQITPPNKGSDAYSVGYRAGFYTGYCAKSILHNIALMFAVGFIWLLSTVFKSALRMKQEQDLTI